VQRESIKDELFSTWTGLIRVNSTSKFITILVHQADGRDIHFADVLFFLKKKGHPKGESNPSILSFSPLGC